MTKINFLLTPIKHLLYENLISIQYLKPVKYKFCVEKKISKLDIGIYYTKKNSQYRSPYL